MANSGSGPIAVAMSASGRRKEDDGVTSSAGCATGTVAAFVDWGVTRDGSAGVLGERASHIPADVNPSTSRSTVIGVPKFEVLPEGLSVTDGTVQLRMHRRFVGFSPMLTPVPQDRQIYRIVERLPNAM
jgi:hypothetical protein